MTRTQYLLVKHAFTCTEKGTSSVLSFNSEVTRSLVKKYSIHVAGIAKIEMKHMTFSQLPLAASPTPIERTKKGITTVVRAPGNIDIAIDDSMARLSRSFVSLVERGTIIAWLRE